MPSHPDVRATSHDRHDALLVAALAAGDLAGTDRDHATDLIETCADCATLHDDLVAIARATASAPPPIATRPRDYRLSPEQAARLRPSGWRRVAGVLAGPRLAFTRPLGIGLTTIGLAGLLLMNVSLGVSLGSSAAAPAGAPAPAANVPAASAAGSAGVPAYVANDGSAPSAAPRGPVAGPVASSVPAPVASDGAVRLGPVPGGTAGSPNSDQFGTESSAGGPKSTSGGTGRVGDVLAGSETVAAPATDLRTVVFVAAVVVGLTLLVLGRVARGAATS
jgi:hypothetical protein